MEWNLVGWGHKPYVEYWILLEMETKVAVNQNIQKQRRNYNCWRKKNNHNTHIYNFRIELYIGTHYAQCLARIVALER